MSHLLPDGFGRVLPQGQLGRVGQSLLHCQITQQVIALEVKKTKRSRTQTKTREEQTSRADEELVFSDSQGFVLVYFVAVVIKRSYRTQHPSSTVSIQESFLCLYIRFIPTSLFSCTHKHTPRLAQTC